jgi:hypothetical protein
MKEIIQKLQEHGLKLGDNDNEVRYSIAETNDTTISFWNGEIFDITVLFPTFS